MTSQKYMKKTLIIIIVIILLAVLVIFIGKKNKAEGPSPEVNQNVQTQQGVSTDSVFNQQASFVISGGNYYFNPNVIRVKEGDRVSITFKNSEGFHNFVIDEFNVATQNVASGAEETVTFVANKKGSFEYYCSVGNHRQMGMKGTLIVE